MPAVPLKLNQDRRHYIRSESARSRTGRPAYEAGLRRPGSLTVWFTDEAIEAWRAGPRTTPGRQRHHLPLAILTALTLRAVFRLALRVPDHTTLNHRAATLEVPRPQRPRSGAGGDAKPVHLHGRAPGGRGGRRRPRAQPHADAGAPELYPSRVNWTGLGSLCPHS
jgi:hypothetical protein